MPSCPNLKSQFGARFQVSHDPAALTPAEKKDPWLQTIPCRFGVIYPFGEGLLAVEVDHHPKTATRLAGIPGVRLHQDGDREKTFLIPVELFEEVARVVRPRRKTQQGIRQMANLFLGKPFEVQKHEEKGGILDLNTLKVITAPGVTGHFEQIECVPFPNYRIL
jgi:hypothetical protein